jgi:hypothetical protein
VVRLFLALGSACNKVVRLFCAEIGTASMVTRTTVLPRRWVVERTFGWMIRWRRLVRDYDRHLIGSEAMIHVPWGPYCSAGSPIHNSQTVTESFCWTQTHAQKMETRISTASVTHHGLKAPATARLDSLPIQALGANDAPAAHHFDGSVLPVQRRQDCLRDSLAGEPGNGCQVLGAKSV